MNNNIDLNLNVTGLDNYPKDAPCLIISNHNRLLDIFYLPMALDDYIVSLVSSRIVYKQDLERLKMVKRYLNAFPIEAHGKKVYSDLCLKYSSMLLENGISVNIFPEGAYLPIDNIVYKGRTGAARIIFEALKNNKYIYLLPVSLDVKSQSDLDSYIPSVQDIVNINILDPIDVREYYYNYLNSDNDIDRNKVLHILTDEGMKKIANSLNRQYVDEYIELRPKGNVIFSDGSVVDTKDAQDYYYINKYEEDLEQLTLKLINRKS